MNKTNGRRPFYPLRWTRTVHATTLVWGVCTILASGCLVEVDRDLEEPSDNISMRGEALSLHTSALSLHTTALSLLGREVRLDACAWSDHPTNITCRQNFRTAPECTYDSTSGVPSNPSQRYVVTPSDPAARSIKWGVSRVYMDAKPPTVYCDQSANRGVFYASGAKPGSVLLRVPGVYDHKRENWIRGAVS